MFAKVQTSVVILSFATTAALQLGKESPASPPSDEAEPDCNSTVAYAFLAREGLPLWPAWQTYFDGCPEGSYTVMVHTQKPGAAKKDLKLVGGTELDNPILGDLRFSYNMVDAMLKLYSGVKKQGAAPNGCTPRWIHMASDACAPVEPCSKVHQYLKQKPGQSIVKRGESNPPSDKAVAKSSQWITLWADHAFALSKDRAIMKASWKGTVKTNDFGAYSVSIQGVDYLGALDELVWPVELEKRGFAMQEIHPGSRTCKSLTYADQHDGDSHPGETDTALEAKETIKNALDWGALFARKFSGTPGQVEALQENLKFRAAQDKLFAWVGDQVDKVTEHVKDEFAHPF